MTLDVDANSVFESLRASHLRIPTENSLYGHLAWLWELIKLQLIHTVRWVDTRDMSADALNKGTAPRDKLLAAMAGKLKLDFPCESYTLPKPKADEKQLVVLSMFEDTVDGPAVSGKSAE